MAAWQLWWTWAVAAGVLAIIEVVVPGYVFLGFAAGAAVSALLILFGGPLAAWLTASLPLLLLFFAVASLLAWVVLRRVLGVRAGQVKVWERDINDN